MFVCLNRNLSFNHSPNNSRRNVKTYCCYGIILQEIEDLDV